MREYSRIMPYLRYCLSLEVRNGVLLDGKPVKLTVSMYSLNKMVPLLIIWSITSRNFFSLERSVRQRTVSVAAIARIATFAKKRSRTRRSCIQVYIPSCLPLRARQRLLVAAPEAISCRKALIVSCRSFEAVHIVIRRCRRVYL